VSGRVGVVLVDDHAFVRGGVRAFLGEIARALCLCEKTVKGHLSNVFAKLELEDRTQAAVLARREGVVGARGPR
jgi:DNA-binding NarL/FixJ family response regulator